eukprot:gene16702-19843_t
MNLVSKQGSPFTVVKSALRTYLPTARLPRFASLNTWNCLWLISLLLASPTVEAAVQIRVACVGDSITYGAGIKDVADRYPAILGKMLGNRFAVRNFGHGGATLLKEGLSPYWKTQAYWKSRVFNPELVIIMLGTNDSRDIYKPLVTRSFSKDLQDMVASYQDLPAAPKIWVCKPVPILPNDFGIVSANLRKNVFPQISRAVLGDSDVQLIDMHKLMANRSDIMTLLPDGVHPSAA